VLDRWNRPRSDRGATSTLSLEILMSRIYPALLVAATVLLACTESRVLEPNEGKPAAADGMTTASQQNGSLRPAGGVCILVSRTPLSPTRRLLDWECRLQHLGLATSHVDETATAGPSGLVVTATVTYTAANGDQLFVSYAGSGSIQDGVAISSGTETAIGGSGRFTGASGSLARTGRMLLPPAFGGEYTTEGTLSY
jgi:hypothetical protein